MNVYTNIYALIVIVWTTVILTDCGEITKVFSDKLDCGPLEVRMAEHEACYDVRSGEEVPCPATAKGGATILKRCQPPYTINSLGDQILNVTYECRGRIWEPSYNACRLDCGPLKIRLSEDEDCYDAKTGAEIPCPDKSQRGARIVKRCRPPYAMTIEEEELLNATYSCEGLWWPRHDVCRSDCGRPTANNKYPWIAAIYDEDEDLKCTGTIISPVHVLTAVSCFTARGASGILWEVMVDIISNSTIVAGKHYSNIHRKKKSMQIRKISVAHAKFYALTNDNTILLEVDKEFDFSGDVQPACVDWDNYYEQKDFSEGNEAVAVDWDYNRNEVVPCENSNELNVQYWHTSTCQENVGKDVWNAFIKNPDFCGTYLKGNESSCGKSIGAGLFFKSSPWRYYLRGITVKVATEPEVTYIFYSAVSVALSWLSEQMNSHLMFIKGSLAIFVTRDKYFSKRKTGCILPEDIKYGRFKLSFGETYRPGAWVSTGTRILLTCVVNSVETPSSTRCTLGEWQPPIDKLECKQPGTCSALLSSTSEDIYCRLNGQEINCVEPVDNTTAIIRCKPFHDISGNKPIYKCKDGLWDQPIGRCTLECGIKRVSVHTLIVGGSNATKNEYPWIVAVYRLEKQICGGTVISKSYVLSAAHCFTESNGMARDKELYTIVAGKYYRNISVEEPSAQSRKIKFLHIHKDYKGNLQKYRDDIALIELDSELIPSLDVQPACLDWENLYEEFDFVDGKQAVVAGWGSTEDGFQSEVLKKLIVPFRPKNVCVAKLPKDFSHQYVVTDKICAGYEDNNTNICDGDSGGGLYFNSDDKRFFVRGIVSLTVKTETGKCDAGKFALYTKVSKYLPWLEKITRRVL